MVDGAGDLLEGRLGSRLAPLPAGPDIADAKAVNLRAQAVPVQAELAARERLAGLVFLPGAVLPGRRHLRIFYSQFEI